MSGLPVPNADGSADSLQGRVDQSVVIAASWDLGMVKAPVSTYVTVIYDHLQAVNFFGTPMVALWKHYFNNVSTLLQAAPYSTMKLVREGGKEGGRETGREGGRKGEREGGKEGGCKGGEIGGEGRKLIGQYKFTFREIYVELKNLWSH